jgi:hypothetical protein
MDLLSVPMFAPSEWQMSYGERAAIEGILAQLKPELGIEIGSAQGGSLARLAEHGKEVHSFDLVKPSVAVEGLANVTCHTGDSHVLLPSFLAELAEAGRNVDYMLIDGDHTADGVRKDLSDTLASPAVQQTVIVLHDTMNDEVRAGIESSLAAHELPKVALVDLDFVPGYLARREPYRLQLWGGLGVIVVGGRGTGLPPAAGHDAFHDLVSLARPMRDVMLELEREGVPLDAAPGAEVESLLRGRVADQAHEHVALRAELARSVATVEQIKSSISWRVTRPLRLARRAWSTRAAGRG